jgi:hypothetical protein
MKFFLDENFPAVVAGPLHAVYDGQHDFVSAYSDPDRYIQVDDLELIPRVASDGFAAFVTFDRAQMSRPAERDAMRLAHLHWVGMRTKESLDGLRNLSWLASSLLGALPHLLNQVPQEPHIYKLKGSLNQVTQLMTTYPI